VSFYCFFHISNLNFNKKFWNFCEFVNKNLNFIELSPLYVCSYDIERLWKILWNLIRFVFLLWGFGDKNRSLFDFRNGGVQPDIVKCFTIV
jgi:hypothetical protein